MNEWKTLGKQTLRAVIGLFICAAGLYLTLRANVGVGPWETLNVGLSRQLPISYGTASVATALVIVLIDLLMHERIGIGTLLDAVLVGKFVDLLDLIGIVPQCRRFLPGVAVLFGGMVLVSIGQWLYMSAGLGCGPRDSFLVGVGRRMARLPIGVVNFIIFIVVTALGYLLHGDVGVGTLLFAVFQSAIMQLVFRIARFEPRSVVHEDVVQTVRRLRRKERVQ